MNDDDKLACEALTVLLLRALYKEPVASITRIEEAADSLAGAVTLSYGMFLAAGRLKIDGETALQPLANE